MKNSLDINELDKLMSNTVIFISLSMSNDSSTRRLKTSIFPPYDAEETI